MWNDFLFQFLVFLGPVQKKFPLTGTPGECLPAAGRAVAGVGGSCRAKTIQLPPLTHTHPPLVTSCCRIDDNVFLPYTVSPVVRFCCRLCDFRFFSGQWWPSIFSSDVFLAHIGILLHCVIPTDVKTFFYDGVLVYF